jgi:hypothetical protein
MNSDKLLCFFKYVCASIILCTNALAYAQTCPSVRLQVAALGASLPRYGLQEFCNISTPPKYYLIDTGDNEETYNDTYDIVDGEEEWIGHSYNNFSIHYATGISALTGTATITESGSAAIDCYQLNIIYDGGVPYTETFVTVTNASDSNQVWSDGGNAYNSMTNGWLSGYGGGYDQSCGDGFHPPSGFPTDSVPDNVNCSSTGLSGSWSTTLLTNNLDQGYLATTCYRGASTTSALSIENDDKMLCANIQNLTPMFPDDSTESNWVGNGSAYISFTGTNCTYANGQKIKFRFEIDGWQPRHSYQFSYLLTTTTTFINSTNIDVISTNVPVDVNPTGSPAQPYYTKSIEIDVPQISAPRLSINISPSSPAAIYDVTGTPPGS